MKRWLSLFLGILLWGHSVVAQDGNIVQPQSIYVRSGPAEAYIAIGAMFQNQTAEPFNRSADGAWILVKYGRGTGWIQASEVRWQTEVSQLPVMAADVTPTARATEPLRLLSPTPSAAQGSVMVSGGEPALVRAGPLRGFPRLGQLTQGTLVEPVSRNEAGDWILIRFPDPISHLPGFGWIARDLVLWRDETMIEALPIIPSDNLTPTATEDASIVIASATPIPVTAAAIATETSLPPTNTDVPIPTVTETIAPTVTLNLPTATETLIPSETMVPASATPEIPSAITETLVATIQAVSPFITNTPNQAAPTSTEESRIIAAPVTATPTIPTETPIPTLEPTYVPVEVPTDTGGSGPAIPILALAAISVAGGLVYLGAFARAMPELRRYEQGFVRNDCPVCDRGTLIVEEKRGSTLGVPSVRRTVRCNTCRSVLREKGPQRWSYAVDRLENPTIYEKFNGREITDDELKAL